MCDSQLPMQHPISYPFISRLSQTMDAIPWHFVDRVVQLLDESSIDDLLEAVDSRLWLKVLQLHHDNRQKYSASLTENRGKLYCVFQNTSTNEYATQEELDRAGRRFVRIETFEVEEATRNPLDRSALQIPVDDENQFPKVIQQYTVGGQEFSLLAYHDESSANKFFLERFYNEVFFTRIDLNYEGSIAMQFVKLHVNEYPYLSHLGLYGNWPRTVLPYIKKFLLRPEGKRPRTVQFETEGDRAVPVDFLVELVDDWKKSDGPQGAFSYDTAEDTDQYAAFMERDPKSKRSYFFRHETRKAIGYCNHSFAGEWEWKFYACECGHAKKECDIMVNIPHLHNF
ncbi:hypothetical protein QR680_015103 [Steinernema hermaphroditum]|uniref:Uncharacterized protein n=1 Tax=Steinernema hermaphroditum TaxID=289476 RepID=A0AA39IB58_9BILA|nr:hypothetical protein QR680_015103 [Steinernema hermaphroditum]